jgi:hypothetical protein
MAHQINMPNWSRRLPFLFCTALTGGLLYGGLALLFYGCSTSLNHCNSRRTDLVVVSGTVKELYVPTDQGGYTDYYAVFNLKYSESNVTYCSVDWDTTPEKSQANDDLQDHPPGSLLSVYVYSGKCYEGDPRDSAFGFGIALLIFGGIVFLALILAWLTTPLNVDAIRAHEQQIQNVDISITYEWGVFKRTVLTGEGVISNDEIVLKADKGMIWRVLGSNFTILPVQLTSLAYNMYDCSRTEVYERRFQYLVAIIVIQGAALALKVVEYRKLRLRETVISAASLETMCVRNLILNVFNVIVNILSMVAAYPNYSVIVWNLLCISVTVGAQLYMTCHIFVVVVLWALNLCTFGCVGGRAQFDVYNMYRTYQAWLSPIHAADAAGAGHDLEELVAPLIPIAAPGPSRIQLKAMCKTHIINSTGIEVKLHRHDAVLISMFRRIRFEGDNARAEGTARFLI